MRAGERDLLLMVLAATAGSADGWSYFGIGHAFVANMTGNTVLVGMAIFGHTGDLVHPLVAVICYLLGVALAAFLTRDVKAGGPWPRIIFATLLIEAILLIACEAGWVEILHLETFDYGLIELSYNLLLGALAFAVGLQSGAMLQLRIPGIVTTYITGTWTSLMSGLVRFASGKPSNPPRDRQTFEERLLMQGAVLAVYFLAAVLTGWILRNAPSAVGVLPAACALLAAILGLLHGQELSAQPL